MSKKAAHDCFSNSSGSYFGFGKQHAAKGRMAHSARRQEWRMLQPFEMTLELILADLVAGASRRVPKDMFVYPETAI